MTKKHYEWVLGGTPPQILRHSQVKHDLLRDYRVDYFLTLVTAPGQERVQLTIVDGFCGGGLYRDVAGREVPGSPIVILQAIKEAQARVMLEMQRHKPIDFDVKLICIDIDESAIAHLRYVLDGHGYGDKLRSGAIETLTGDFYELSEPVINEVARRSPRAGRAIFILDQYGYDKVPLATINTIFKKFKGAEVILNFNVDSLINFLNPKNLSDFERKTGITDAVPADLLDKETRLPGYRRTVQSNLHQRIIQGSGAKYFTPFFIRPERGHGDYWLLHLSQHAKARDVMATTHWKYNNHFSHHGGAGFDMFSTGYAAKIDDQDKIQRGFLFDDLAEKISIETMLEQIPRYLAEAKEGISFEAFFAQRINSTPATKAMVEKTVLQLAHANEIVITDENGKIRSPRVAIKSTDLIKPYPQKLFSF